MRRGRGGCSFISVRGEGVGVEGCNQETWFKSVTQLLSHHLIIAVPTSSFTFPWTRPHINPLIYVLDKNYRLINVKSLLINFLEINTYIKRLMLGHKTQFQSEIRQKMNSAVFNMSVWVFKKIPDLSCTCKNLLSTIYVESVEKWNLNRASTLTEKYM